MTGDRAAIPEEPLRAPDSPIPASLLGYGPEMASGDNEVLTPDHRVPRRRATFAFASNALEEPVDEGIRKCAHELARRFATLGVTAHPVRSDDSWAARKLLLSRSLTRAARRAGAVLYLPSQSATSGTFLRVALLRLTARVPVTLLSMQPTRLNRLRFVPRGLRPLLVLSPSPAVVAEASRVGLPATFVPMGVDTDRFHPVTAVEKAALRNRHALGEGPIVLHVGHARSGRNLDWLLGVGAETGATAVAVFGASQGRDEPVVARLRAGGVGVITDFVPKIEELYQLADCYVFTVEDELSAIGVPLSVLEAMACNIPVVTTQFGGLPEMLREGPGLAFITAGEELMATLRKTLETSPAAVATREMVLPYSWEAVAERIAEEVKAVA